MHTFKPCAGEDVSATLDAEVCASQQPDKSVRHAYASCDNSTLAPSHACGVHSRIQPSIVSENLVRPMSNASSVAGVYARNASALVHGTAPLEVRESASGGRPDQREDAEQCSEDVSAHGGYVRESQSCTQ